MGRKCPNEVRKKISIGIKKFLSKNGHWRTGKKHNEDTKRKMSLSCLGNKNWGILHTKEKIKKNCLLCNKEMLLVPCKAKIRRFCSYRCGTLYQFKIKGHPRFINGLYIEYPNNFNEILREQIRNRDGRKCQLCGCPEIECRRKLDVHHMDYDKNNSNPNNLISLCIGCHQKTGASRPYWTNYFKQKSEIIL